MLFADTVFDRCSGGLELLFDKTKNHLVEIPDKDKISLKDFLQWIKNNKLKERPELFVQDNSVYVELLLYSHIKLHCNH